MVDITNATTVPWGSDDDAIDSLEALIAEIKRKPSKPENIHYGNGLLVWHLAHPVSEPDPDFDAAAWDQEWAQIEAEMKVASLVHEQAEMEEWMIDLADE